MKALFPYHLLLVLLAAISLSCGSSDNPLQPSNDNIMEIRGADLSSVPYIRNKGVEYLNENGNIENILSVLERYSMNTVRLRIWHSPGDGNSGLNQVKNFANEARSFGMKILLDVHYSDTWADPGNQTPPEKWDGLSYPVLLDSVYDYTNKLMLEIQPDLIQIGNEINSGILFPYGEFPDNEDQFLTILDTAIHAVRSQDSLCKIILHFAGFEESDWFFGVVDTLDYDVMALSYYPIWHGKDLNSLSDAIAGLVSDYERQILIAETAYPFTLDWNDLTNNIVGQEDQLILPDYEAIPIGQRNFLSKIFEILGDQQEGLGVCYWGGEMVAYDGPESTNGSDWENQALFSFENRAVPAIQVFDNILK